MKKNYESVYRMKLTGYQVRTAIGILNERRLALKSQGCTLENSEEYVDVCMLGAAPFAALGFIKYNGMTAEKIAKAWIRSEILMPKKILFGGTNKLIGQEDKRK